MIRLAILAALVFAQASAPPPASGQQDVSIQEALLRVKPAVVLVIAEVAAEVTLDCGSGPLKVTPPAVRETGTGWFIDGKDGAVVGVLTFVSLAPGPQGGIVQGFNFVIPSQVIKRLSELVAADSEDTRRGDA